MEEHKKKMKICDGKSKIRSKGKGRGLGIGKGKGPLNRRIKKELFRNRKK